MVSQAGGIALAGQDVRHVISKHRQQPGREEAPTCSAFRSRFPSVYLEGAGKTQVTCTRVLSFGPEAGGWCGLSLDNILRTLTHSGHAGQASRVNQDTDAYQSHHLQEVGQISCTHFPDRETEAHRCQQPQGWSPSPRGRDKSETGRFLPDFLPTPHAHIHTHQAPRPGHPVTTAQGACCGRLLLPGAFGKRGQPPSGSQARP